MSNTKNASPLLHGKITNTPLDFVTTRLYFIFPLSYNAIQCLNTIVYRNDDLGLWINYWSGTHILWGIIWGLAHIILSKSIFSVNNFVITHSIFELWALWAGGFLSNNAQKLNAPEILDTLLDTIFACLGMLIIGLIMQ